MFAHSAVLIRGRQRIRHLDSSDFRGFQGEGGSAGLFPWRIVPAGACGSHRHNVVGSEAHGSDNWYRMEADSRHGEADHAGSFRCKFQEIR